MQEILTRLTQKKSSILIEVLITITILSVGLTLIIRSYAQSLRASAYTVDYSTAMILMENKIYPYILNGYIEDGLDEEGDFDKPNQKFHYQLTVHGAGNKVSLADLNEVKIIVSWPVRTGQKSISTTTYLFNLKK